MEDLKLRNCPFCGSKAEYIYTNYGGNEIEDLAHGVACVGENECALQFVFDSTKEKVVNLWNTRAESAELITLQDRSQYPLNKEEAIERWNHRAANATVLTLVAALKECDDLLMKGEETVDWYYASGLKGQVEAALLAAGGV